MISVIMPVYNGDKWIEDAINSVLNQTYSNWELFIINGASTDNTEVICKKFDDKRIHYVSVEYCEQVDKINKGLRWCTGEYISFLACDDSYHINFMDEMLKCLENHSEIDFVYSNQIIKTYGYNDKLLSEHPSDHGNLDCWEGYNKLFHTNHVGLFWLFRKHILSAVTIDQPKYVKAWAWDWDFTLKVCEAGFKFMYLNKILGTWRVHKSSYTGSNNQEHMDKLKKYCQNKARERRK